MSKAPSRAGRFFTALARILILTALFAGFGMGLGLFVGIIGSVIYAAIKHVHVDMTMAYRDVAIPVAILAAAGSFLYNTMTALRRVMRGPAA